MIYEWKKLYKDTSQFGTIGNYAWFKMSTSIAVRLPSEYQEVEYIKGGQGQCIDTGIVVRPSGFKVELDIKYSEQYNHGGSCLNICGTRFSDGQFNANHGNNGQINVYCWTNAATNGAVRSLRVTQTILNNRNTFSLSNDRATYSTISVNTETSQWTNPENKTLILLGTRNAQGQINGYNGNTVYCYASRIYFNDVLIGDFVPCYRKSDGEIGLYDIVTRRFRTNVGTGTFDKGVDVRVKPLSTARSYLAATNVGDYALFAGGSNSATVDAYDENLIRSTAVDLSESKTNHAATSTASYALFAGGSNSITVDAYNGHLVKTSIEGIYDPIEDFSATSVGDYALFAGGGYDGECYGDIYAYDDDLTIQYTFFSVAKRNLTAATIGNYAVFYGGYDQYLNDVSEIEVFDEYLTRIPAGLYTTTPRSYLASTAIDGYALFGGGSDIDTSYNIVDAVSSDLTMFRLNTGLSENKENLTATSVGDYALFAGGISGSTLCQTVDAYDDLLIKTTVNPLSVARSGLTSAEKGGYAIIAGGEINAISSNKVDVYDANLNHFNSV